MPTLVYIVTIIDATANVSIRYTILQSDVPRTSTPNSINSHIDLQGVGAWIEGVETLQVVGSASTELLEPVEENVSRELERMLRYESMDSPTIKETISLPPQLTPPVSTRESTDPSDEKQGKEYHT